MIVYSRYKGVDAHFVDLFFFLTSFACVIPMAVKAEVDHRYLCPPMVGALAGPTSLVKNPCSCLPQFTIRMCLPPRCVLINPIVSLRPHALPRNYMVHLSRLPLQCSPLDQRTRYFRSSRRPPSVPHHAQPPNPPVLPCMPAAVFLRAFQRLPEGQIESMWHMFATHLREGWTRSSSLFHASPATSTVVVGDASSVASGSVVGGAGGDDLLAREVDGEVFVLFVRNLHVTSSVAQGVGKLCTSLAEEVNTYTQASSLVL